MVVVDRTAEQYRALTQACGLVDRSERGKLALTGSEVKAFLQGQVSNDVEALKPGEGCYATFLTPKGKMLGDLRVIDTGDEVWLDTERVALQALFTMIRKFKLGMDVELHKRTLQQALLSLVGPDARAIAGAEDLPDREHANRRAEIAGVPVLEIVTDTGIDLVCAAEDSGRLAGTLLERGAVAVSEDDAEVVRVERGRPRYGIDMDEKTIPEEAGLNDRAVSFEKGCYVGQETVARLHWRGKPNRHLRGLRLSAPATTGDELRLGEKVVGRVGTAVVSPVHGPIALALIRREANPGDRLTVGDGGVEAEVVELPFAAESDPA
jgi:folate-binding protein YgfZ